MKFGKTVCVGLMVSALLVMLLGCKKNEGPAERAGKAIDNTAEKAGKKIEKAGENIRDAAKGNKK